MNSDSKTLRPPRLRPTGDVNQDGFQRDIRDGLVKLYKEPLLANRVLSATVGTANTTVAHGLGRTPVAWEIVDKLGPGDIYRVSWDSTNLVLISSASVEIKLRVH